MKNLILILFVFIFSNCSGQNNFFWSYNNVATGSAPTVTTTVISAITSTTATSGGNVTSDGGASVTARGVCWYTSTNPTTANSHTSDGTGTGSYSSSLTSLTDGATYYVRAYATNSAGTSYGSNVSFVAECTRPSGLGLIPKLYSMVNNVDITSGNWCPYNNSAPNDAQSTYRAVMSTFFDGADIYDGTDGGCTKCPDGYYASWSGSGWGSGRVSGGKFYNCH